MATPHLAHVEQDRLPYTQRFSTALGMSFLIATVTNRRKFGVLKQHKSALWHSWSPAASGQVGRAASLERRTTFPGWLPSRHKTWRSYPSPTSPSVPMTPLPPSYKDLCDYIGTIWTTQNNVPISRPVTESHLQNPLYHIREYSPDLGIRMWDLWGL